MKLSEQLKVIVPTDRIRIIQGKRGNRGIKFYIAGGWGSFSTRTRKRNF